MKRKILSLALALMMIISVAAALPVSADVVEPIIVAADDFTSGSAGNSGNLTKSPTDDHGWIPGAKGFLFHKNTNDDVTYTVNAPVGGYYNLYLAGAKYQNTGIYSLYVNGAETADRTDIVLSTSSTADTDAQVSPAIPVKLNEGDNTIRLQATKSAAGDYFYGFKLEYAGESLNEIFLNPRGGVYSSTGHIFSVSTDPTYDGMTWGAGNGGVYIWNGTTNGLDYTLNLDESEAGMYAVYVAVGDEGTSTGCVTVGDSTTGYTAINASGARTTAKETYLGVVDIPAGSQTLQLRFKVGSVKLNLYDIKLAKVQTCTITANAEEGGEATGATVAKGASATITAAANSGYIFDGWYEGSTKVSAATSYTVESVTADRTFTAKFVKGTIISVPSFDTSYENHATGNYANVGTGGLTNKNGLDWIPAGNLLSGPNTNLKYNVSGIEAGWYDIYAAFSYSSASSSYNVGRFKLYQDDTLINGNFGPADAGLTSENTPVEVYVGKINVPAEGTSFIFKGSSSYGYIRGFRVTYCDPQPVFYTITATYGEGGTATGTATVAEGSDVTLTATADDGYVFDGWYEGSTKVSSDATYTFTATADKTYEAKFVAAVVIKANTFTQNIFHQGSNSYCHFFSAGAPTYEGLSWGSGETGVAFYNAVKTYEDYLSTTVNVPEAGYYDVYLAAGTVKASYAKVTVDGYVAAGTIQATATTTTAKENNLGRIWVNVGDTLTINVLPNGGYTNVYDLMLRYSDDQTSVPAQVVSAGVDGTVTALGAPVSFGAAQSDATSWIPGGQALYRYTSPDDHSYGTYNVKLYEDGWYDIYLGAYDYTAATVSLGYKIFDGEELIVPTRTLVGATGSTDSNSASILVASVYLTKGEHTIKLEATGGADYVYGMKFEYIGDEKTSGTITFTEDGSDVFAEVVIADADAVLFLVQYEGTGAEKRMVANSYAAANAPSTKDGTNYFYKAQLKTIGSGEVKAFLWKADGSFAPLCAPVTLN